MKSRVVHSLVVVILIALGVLTALAGASAASADDFTGTKYSDASAEIAKRNSKAVIATVTGDSLAIDDCIVTSWRQSMMLDASHNGSGRTNEILVNLNCNALVAEAGVPGNSAASPMGKQAKKDLENSEYITEHPEDCHVSDEALAYCQKLCARTGKCQV